MSTFNTSVSRAVTGRGRTERRRAPGTLTTLAEADQRNQGPFGFPTIQQRLQQRFPNRFGGQGEPSPIPGQTAPLTGGPVASPANLAEFSAAFPDVGPTGLEVAAGQSPEFIATQLETKRQTDAINDIVNRQLAPLEGFEPGGGEFAGEAEAAIRAIIANPEAISPETQQAAISAGTETILGRERANAQQLQENLAARGISDSGLSFALAQAGGEASARGIAEVRRDVLIQAGLARSAREDANLRLASSIIGGREQLGLRRAEDISQVTGLTEVPTVGFGDIEADTKLDAVMDAASEEDAGRRIDDLLATLFGGVLAFGLGQLTRRLA